MAKKIDYEALSQKISRLIVDHLNEDEIPIPAADCLDIAFALDRLREIGEVLEGKYQEI